MSVRSALASLRGFPSRYRGGSNVRRPGRVHGATDGSRLPTVSTTVKRGTNTTNSNTNKPNKDHPVPLRLNDYQPGLMAAVLDRDEQGNLVRKAGIMGYRPGCWRSPSWRPDPCRAAAGA